MIDPPFIDLMAPIIYDIRVKGDRVVAACFLVYFVLLFTFPFKRDAAWPSQEWGLLTF
jgi:hypothetical protein